MFQLDQTIVSETIIAEDFVCNLSACKGACCVKGDAGAPLDKEEVTILKTIYPKVKPFLSPKGIEAIEQQGTSITTKVKELETPLVNGEECAYVVFDANGTALCGIEKAYDKGVIKWRKPISCHLFPVRTKQYATFTAVSYEKWHICDPACVLGINLQVPIYKFVKQALIRRFGKKWYAKLEIMANKITKK